MTDRRPDNRRPAQGSRRPARQAVPARQTGPVRSARPSSTPARGPRRPAAPAGRFGAPDRRYAALKWALLAALLAYAVLVVGANSARDVDFAVIRDKMAAAPGIGGLRAIDENGFQERFDVAPEGCEGWLLYGSDEIMNVSEVLVAKGGEAALNRLEAAARGRVEAQLSVFRSYGVDQKDLLEGAVLFTRGDYLFYGVGGDVRAWEDAFLSCIR